MSLGLAGRREGGRRLSAQRSVPSRRPAPQAPTNGRAERAGPSLPRPDPQTAGGTVGNKARSDGLSPEPHVWA